MKHEYNLKCPSCGAEFSAEIPDHDMGPHPCINQCGAAFVTYRGRTRASRWVVVPVYKRALA